MEISCRTFLGDRSGSTELEYALIGNPLPYSRFKIYDVILRSLSASNRRDLPHDPSVRNQRVDLGDDENCMNNKDRSVQIKIRFFTQRSRRFNEDSKMTN